MKKSIILMGIAVMAFASCAKDTVKETNNGRAIDFRVATQTRATEVTTANLETFYVTAIDKNASNYFTDVAFTKIDSYFHSSPAYYWPGDGSSLNFYAYAPSATDLGVTAVITGTSQKLTGFSPKTEIKDQIDLVTTTASGNKTNEATGVAMTFDHQLAQIEVKAKNANEGYVYTVYGVKLSNIVAKGDYDFADPTSPWELDESVTAEYKVEYTSAGRLLDEHATNLMETEGENAMLLPQQLTAWVPGNANTNGNYISVLAYVETADGAKVFPTTADEYGWLSVPVGTEWKAGYKYVYTLDFSNGAGFPEPGPEPDPDPDPIFGDPIKFSMEVTGWEKTSVVTE